MRSWLLDADCNDQYSVIHGGGEKVDIFLNTSTEPVLLKGRPVSKHVVSGVCNEMHISELCFHLELTLDNQVTNISHD